MLAFFDHRQLWLIHSFKMLVSLSHLAAKLTMFIWVLCIIIWYTRPCHKKAVPNKKSGLTATIAASGLAWNWLGKECLKRIMLGLNVCWNGHRHSSCGFVGTDHRADPGLNPKHTSYAFSIYSQILNYFCHCHFHWRFSMEYQSPLRTTCLSFRNYLSILIPRWM